MDTTANRLKKAMGIRNMRQVDLIEKTQIPKSAMSQYISGKFLPKQNRLTALAKALDVNESWLMGYDVPMEREYVESIIKDRLTNPITSTDFLVLKSIRTGLDYSSGNTAETIHFEPTQAERPSKLPTEYFATHAKDDSMMCKGIIKGDLMIFDTDIHDLEALNGKIVLVSFDPSREAVLRQISIHGDTVILQSFSSGSTPEIFDYYVMDNHVKLIGRLLRVRRSYFE